MTHLKRLILVGAGPGDEELITLKGIRALQEADVVLYDALANKKLLMHCRAATKTIFVGKRAGLHHYQQFEINRMIVRYAKKGLTVIRLKGGDPFVFGRGHEELAYAKKHGIEVSIVPGVSSAIAVPALQGIPLTKRGITQSFTVVTATDKAGLLSRDLITAAAGNSTVVILMGMKKLPLILTLFSKTRSASEPVAIIQQGSTPDEKMVIGNVKDIHEKVLNESIVSPAIIIIGEVVKEATKELSYITRSNSL